MKAYGIIFVLARQVRYIAGIPGCAVVCRECGQQDVVSVGDVKLVRT